MSTAGKPIECRGAVVWEVNAPYVIETIVVDPPKTREVRIKVHSAGLCHSDMHTQAGFNKDWGFPAVLGHEGAGVIESVGDEVTDLKTGDVVVLCFEAYCGTCKLCKNPNAYMCERQPRDNLLLDGTSRVSCKGQSLQVLCGLGCFAEYVVVNEINVAKVNKAANTRTVCLASCCILTGYGAVINEGKVPAGASCAIWGLGGVGMSAVMACRESGATKIIGIDINPRKFELAKELGCTEVLNPKEVPSVPEALSKMADGGVDFCFVTVGSLSVMEEAIASSHPHWGRTVLIGLTRMDAKLSIPVFDLIFGRRVVGTWGGSYRSRLAIPQLVEKIVEGKIPLEKLISHRLPLGKINEGFQMLRDGESLRTLIDFDLKE